MSNILIIGNGFDIYHGLPTRYNDFLFLAENWNSFIEKYGYFISKKAIVSKMMQNEYIVCIKTFYAEVIYAEK